MRQGWQIAYPEVVRLVAVGTEGAHVAWECAWLMPRCVCEVRYRPAVVFWDDGAVAEGFAW